MKNSLFNLSQTLKDLLNDFSNHLKDKAIHVTTSEKETWNSKTDDSKIASATVLGHVKVGENLSIDAGGRLSVTSGSALVPGGTATAITLDITPKHLGLYTFKSSFNNNGSATTINGKPLYKDGTTTAPKLLINRIYNIYYSSSDNNGNGAFFIRASTEGTAIAANVLAGKTFSNDSETGLTGTMNNYAGVNLTGSHFRSTTPNAIFAYVATSGFSGFIDTASRIVITDPNFTAENIVSGKSIFGLTGTAPTGRRLVVFSGISQNHSINVSLTSMGFIPSVIRLNIGVYEAFWTPYKSYAVALDTYGNNVTTFWSSYSGGILSINVPYAALEFNFFAWE